MTAAASRRIRTGTVATVLALAALVLAVALTVREAGEWLRQRLEAALQERLVPQLRIARPLDIELWPAPSVGVRGITLHEDSGATPLAIDSITLRLDASRLVRGEIALDALEVSGLALTLRRDAQGWNVERWLRKTDGGGNTALPTIERIELAGGTIRLEGAAAAELANLSFTAGPIAPDAIGSLRASGRLAVQRPASGALQVALEAAYRLDGARVTTNDMELAFEGELAGWQVSDAALRAEALTLGGTDGPHLKGTTLSLDAALEETAVEIRTTLAELIGTGSGWQGTDLSLVGEVRLAPGAFAGTLSAPRIKAAASEWRVPSLTARLASSDGLPPFELELSASATAPAGDSPLALDIAHAKADIPHPAGRPDPLALDFSGTVALDPARRTASGTIAGRFDASRFEGDWRFDPTSSPPVRLKMSLDRLDLDPYLPPAGEDTDPADLTAWRDWPVAAELEIGKLRYHDIVSEGARLRLSGAVTDGR